MSVRKPLSLVVLAKGARGRACVDALAAHGADVRAVLVQATAGVDDHGLRGMRVGNPDDDLHTRLAALRPDLLILAGYGHILPDRFLRLPRLGVINLHGGRLPEYRGSSPMNWALINGDREVTFTVIRAERGVDTGDILAQRTIPVGPDDTIADLHRQANEQFPAMLLEVIEQWARGTLRPRPQDQAAARYFPRRFPDDGLILFDQLDATALHDTVRALTRPYPGAFGFHGGRRIRLWRTRLTARPFHGEPGRIYRASDEGILVGARDRCLWVTDATWADDDRSILGSIPRYDELATLRRAVQAWHEHGIRGGPQAGVSATQAQPGTGEPVRGG